MKQISFRVDEELIKRTEELSKLENLEKSTILRQALERGVKSLSEEAVVSLYRKNVISLSEASYLTGLGAGELMELLKKHRVRSKITIEDFEKGKKTAEELV